MPPLCSQCRLALWKSVHTRADMPHRSGFSNKACFHGDLSPLLCYFMVAEHAVHTQSLILSWNRTKQTKKRKNRTSIGTRIAFAWTNACVHLRQCARANWRRASCTMRTRMLLGSGKCQCCCCCRCAAICMCCCSTSSRDSASRHCHFFLGICRSFFLMLSRVSWNDAFFCRGCFSPVECLEEC